MIGLYRYRTHKSIDFSKASGNNDINRNYGVSIGFLTLLARNALHSYSYNTTEFHIQSEILKSKFTSFFLPSFSFNFSSSVSVTCELWSGAGVGCRTLAPSTLFTWTTILCELVANAISVRYTITENEVDKIMIKKW